MGIAERLKLAREAVGLPQRVVQERCGIDDSSLSAFEKGRSEPRLGQLEKLAQVYHVPLSYFFDAGEVRVQTVLWRQRPENDKEIQAQFLELCRQYRQLEVWTGEVSLPSLPTFALPNGRLDYAQVENLAYNVRIAMKLGERPGQSLLVTLEEVYGVKVFHLDLGSEGMAASARGDEFGAAILLNARCSRWRRNHDLAHELFHLLTWQYYQHTEEMAAPDEQEEKFATCFAGNLLLPAEPLKAALSQATDAAGKISFSRLDEIARGFDVSLESLLWRMHFLSKWQEDQTKKYIEHAQAYIRTAPRRQDTFPPNLLPQRYRALAIRALQEGQISLSRLVHYLQISRREAEQFLTEGQGDYAEVPTSAA